MAILTWNDSDNKEFFNGVSKVVVFPRGVAGDYPMGYAWEGVTAVNLKPEGGEPTELFAANTLYATLMSAVKFKGTIEAYTSPAAFAQCDGVVESGPGVNLRGQSRKSFALAWRREKSTETNPTAGYIIEIMYGLLASPSEVPAATINDSPDATTFSWELSSTPVSTDGAEPVASLYIDSNNADPALLTWLEEALYGTALLDPYCPLPDAINAQANA